MFHPRLIPPSTSFSCRGLDRRRYHGTRDRLRRLPIEDPAEVQAFLRDLPLALDRKFVTFVLGFPRKYLAGTPRTDIVKHYALMASLGRGR